MDCSFILVVDINSKGVCIYIADETNETRRSALRNRPSGKTVMHATRLTKRLWSEPSEHGPGWPARGCVGEQYYVGLILFLYASDGGGEVVPISGEWRSVFVKKCRLSMYYYVCLCKVLKWRM